jgi:hypothetical protein
VDDEPLARRHAVGDDAVLAGEPKVAADEDPGHASYWKSGCPDDARRITDQLVAAAATAYVAPLRLALAFSGSDNDATVFEYLERAVEDHAPRLIWLEVWPLFRHLHHHSRFVELARRTGLPPQPS